MKAISLKAANRNMSGIADMEIGDGDFYVCDEKVFGDKAEHPVSFIFFDGIAIGHSYDEKTGEMITLQMTYTKKENITKSQIQAMSLPTGDDPMDSPYIFREIAMLEGNVKRVNI